MAEAQLVTENSVGERGLQLAFAEEDADHRAFRAAVAIEELARPVMVAEPGFKLAHHQDANPIGLGRDILSKLDMDEIMQPMVRRRDHLARIVSSDGAEF
jgi:hypothetical protein